MADVADQTYSERALEAVSRQFFEHVPHVRALQLEIQELKTSRSRVVLPYREELVGDPDSGVVHGGAITTLIDTACGGAVFMSLPRPIPIATLDLRIDYLRPGRPHQPVTAEAHCYKLTRSVAFVRATAYDDSPQDQVATAMGTFMLSTRMGTSARRSEKAP